MKQNREPGNKPSHILSNDFLPRVPRPFNEKRTVFSTNSTEKTILHAKE